MDQDAPDTKRTRRPIKRIIAISIIIILAIAATLLYRNFNALVANALNQSFESNIISDLYELKFENLNVNPFEGSIRVSNVTLQPREIPLNDYPYINSSFRLKTDKLTLVNVDLYLLLKSNVLDLERISIRRPDVELMLGGENHILLPFKDSTLVAGQPEKTKKKAIDSFALNKFELIDASFHVTNSTKQREFRIGKFDISLHDLKISQRPGKDVIAFKEVELSVGEFSGRLLKGPISKVTLKKYNLKVDSLNIQRRPDTTLFHFDNLRAGVDGLDIQTADSVFHITLKSLELSYKERSIKMRDLSFMPNVSDAVLQRKYKYQHTSFSGKVGTLDIVNLNFDSLLNRHKIFIDEILIDKAAASIFKDKTKPMDKKRMPSYLGQTVKSIPMPMLIKHIRAKHVHIVNLERKPDSTLAKVNIHRATLDVKNVTNISTTNNLLMSADAYVENKAHFKLALSFDYVKPQFNFEGSVLKFDLTDLNPLFLAYTPATITKGTLDAIAFSGIAKQTEADGTLKFLYHDLKLDLELHNQAKWKSSVIAFGANTVLNSSNPAGKNLPERIVKFHIERDMNKGFINVIMKSLLNGLKETMIMSKENRKAYHEAKSKSRRSQ